MSNNDFSGNLPEKLEEQGNYGSMCSVCLQHRNMKDQEHL